MTISLSSNKSTWRYSTPTSARKSSRSRTSLTTLAAAQGDGCWGTQWTESLPLLHSLLIVVDNVTSFQKKTIGLAFSTIPTLRLPQVLDKLGQIMSVCKSAIRGGNEDLSEDEFRTLKELSTKRLTSDQRTFSK
ncbi:hypothetical protein H5410_045164, partial [Solanum commersonii]